MRWALVLLAVLAPLSASAHGFEVGALALDELEPGRFAVAWRAPEDSRRVTPARVTIRFPAHCRRQHHELHCGSEGLHGTIAFDDLPDPRTTIAVRIDRLDGRHLEAMVRGDSPVLDVGRASTTFAAFEEAARRVLRLDALVLLALALVVDRRAWLWGFIGAHGLGLVLSAHLSVPGAPLAATLGAGVVLAARQAAFASGPQRGWGAVAALLGLGLGLAHEGTGSSWPFALWAALFHLTALALLVFSAHYACSRSAPRLRLALAYLTGSAGALWVIAALAGDPVTAWW